MFYRLTDGIIRSFRPGVPTLYVTANVRSPEIMIFSIHRPDLKGRCLAQPGAVVADKQMCRIRIFHDGRKSSNRLAKNIVSLVVVNG